MAESFIMWSPLLGAAAWLAVTLYLVVQQRYRTWTEVFFIGLCTFTGLYGLCDALFFRESVEPWLRIAAAASLATVTFAVFFLFLYGVSLYRRFRGVLLLALLPVAFFVVTFSERMFDGFQSLNGQGPPYVPLYDTTWLYPWIALLAALGAAGMYGILRTYLEVHRQSPRLARRIGITLLGLLITALAGFATNTYLAVSGEPAPPLFSTALVLPGVLIFFAVTPNAVTRLDHAILRRKASLYDVKGAFLTFSDGTLIGSRLAPEEKMIDPDSFSATLDVIQNFMRTSFPTLRGKWLKSIRHGGYTLVMERGAHAYLTLVIAGVENDQLRRQMIEQLRGFERQNEQALEHWRGVAADAKGTNDLLKSLLSPT